MFFSREFKWVLWEHLPLKDFSVIFCVIRPKISQTKTVYIAWSCGGPGTFTAQWYALTHWVSLLNNLCDESVGKLSNALRHLPISLPPGTMNRFQKKKSAQHELCESEHSMQHLNGAQWITRQCFQHRKSVAIIPFYRWWSTVPSNPAFAVASE